VAVAVVAVVVTAEIRVLAALRGITPVGLIAERIIVVIVVPYIIHLPILGREK
jgi:hypothetical protein